MFRTNLFSIIKVTSVTYENNNKHTYIIYTNYKTSIIKMLHWELIKRHLSFTGMGKAWLRGRWIYLAKYVNKLKMIIKPIIKCLYIIFKSLHLQCFNSWLKQCPKYLTLASHPVNCYKLPSVYYCFSLFALFSFGEDNLLDRIKMTEIWLEYDQKNIDNDKPYFLNLTEIHDNNKHQLYPKKIMVWSVWTGPPAPVRKLSLAGTPSQPCLAPLQEKNIRHGN